MKRIAAVALLLAIAGFAEAATPNRPSDPSRAATVRALMLDTYVDGIDQELAQRLLTPADVTTLQRLLAETAFPRKDNVVAFLSWLDPENSRTALAQLVVGAASDRETKRAQKIAAQLLSELPRSIASEQPTADDPTITSMATVSAAVADPAPSIDIAPIDAVNHLSVDEPVDVARLDYIFSVASRILGRKEFRDDTSCCYKLCTTGIPGTFGASGDGLDEIDNADELQRVLAISTARVKVVSAINFCNGKKKLNILACSESPGDSIVLVRMTRAADEALLWLRELGRNVGLAYASSGKNFMFAHGTNAKRRGITAEQCARLHAPPAESGLVLDSAGVCEDLDDDGVYDELDNCPPGFAELEDTANNDQSDINGDDIGDRCDVGPLVAAAPADATAGSIAAPLQFSWERGSAIRVEVQYSADPAFAKKSKLISSGERFAIDPFYRPPAVVWTEVLRLGIDGAPIYWRVSGKDSRKNPVISTNRTLTLAPLGVPVITTADGAEFDIDLADRPTLTWEANGSTIFRVTFGVNPELTGTTVLSNKKFTIGTSRWLVFVDVWKKVLKDLVPVNPSGEIWFKVDGRDPLGREVTSTTGRIIVKDLPETTGS